MPTQHLRSKSRKKGLFLTHSIFVDQLRVQDSRLSFYTRIIIYISLFSLAPVFEVFSSKEPKAGVAAEQVYIPKYGKNGEIIWSLNAKEVNPNDEVIEEKGVKVFVDSAAIMYLLGTEMDYKKEELSSSFVFNNPNETERCGCGESFKI